MPADWHALAECLGADPDLFFPVRGESTMEAKKVCAGCPVREECLEEALANGEKFGIWGGMSERERRRMRRARNEAKVGDRVVIHRAELGKVSRAAYDRGCRCPECIAKRGTSKLVDHPIVNCDWCGDPFRQAQHTQRFDSEWCREQAKEQRRPAFANRGGGAREDLAG